MTTELDFKRECEGLVREYFTHGVVTDIEDSLKELLGRPGWTAHTGVPDRSAAFARSPLGGPRPIPSSPLAFSSASSALSPAALRSTVVKRAVIAALDRGAREREMAARLLRALRKSNVISREHGEAGFDLLLQSLESLTIDVPNAQDDMNVFLARAVVDDVVSDEFLEECAEASGLDVEARRVALSARGALRAPGGEDRVLDAWGGPDGGTAGFAGREFDRLVSEYVESRDAREASRRIVELHVPFYHHEFVRRALVAAIEEARARPRYLKRVTELLGYLGAAGVISGTQFAKGFARVAVGLKELVLDTPDAQERFEKIVADARGRGLLPAGLSAWASIRAGGASAGSSFGDEPISGAGKTEAITTDDTTPRKRGLRGGGHLMRLDSAPDLIALARGLNPATADSKKQTPSGSSHPRGSASEFERARASPLKPTQPSLTDLKRRGSSNAAAPAGGTVSASIEPAVGSSTGTSPAGTFSAGTSSTGTSFEGASSVPEPRVKNASPGRKPEPRGAMSAVPARLSTWNRVDANWSGLRAPRANRLDGGSNLSAFSGSDSDYVRPKPKRPLPDLRSGTSRRLAVEHPSDASSAGRSGRRWNAFGGFSAAREGPSFASGKSAWKARFEPAPSRVSGEDARAFKNDHWLRRFRRLRRVRSCPGGLQELENSQHILSLGYVHRHRPFADEYEVGEAIGTGGFAVVRKATHRASGIVYAVKTLRVRARGGGSDSEDSEDDDSEDADYSSVGSDSDGASDSAPRKLAAMSMAEMTNELIMMQQLSGHPNIVTVKEFFTEDADGRVASGVDATTSVRCSGGAPGEGPIPDSRASAAGAVHVVMELLEGQELVDAIEQHGTYDESDAKIVMGKMLDAIAFMHARGVVHRDLKLENLVLAKPDDLSSVTLVDFGLAKALMARERAENVCGTLSYVAPEALAAGQYGQGVDVWALGVAMHALLTGVWPFDDEDEDELMAKIIACELDFEGPSAPEEFSWISRDAKDLLRGLLEPNPKHRVTAAQALEHAWFTGQRGNTAERLRRVHARLSALAAASRQHPERRFRPNDALASLGEPSEEVFVLTSGTCGVFAATAGPLAKQGDVTRIGTRRKGNLVGEIPCVGETDGGGNPPSRLTVVAESEVRALVFQRSDAVWAVGHDYRLSDEFEDALRERRRLLAKRARLAVRAERTAAMERSSSGEFGNRRARDGSPSGRAERLAVRRATSEYAERPAS